ncbi:MAG: DUF669 domain-containing protein [Ruminococcus sp.]|nr:DUF669 domain-containing protein [Ruminococcus sp.]
MIKQYNGFKAERTSGREPLPAGGYVAKILNAEVKTTQSGKDMLVLSFDITEGEHAGFSRLTTTPTPTKTRSGAACTACSCQPTTAPSATDGASAASMNSLRLLKKAIPVITSTGTKPRSRASRSAFCSVRRNGRRTTATAGRRSAAP